MQRTVYPRNMTRSALALVVLCCAILDANCKRIVEKPIDLLHTGDVQLNNSAYTPRHLAGYFKV